MPKNNTMLIDTATSHNYPPVKTDRTHAQSLQSKLTAPAPSQTHNTHKHPSQMFWWSWVNAFIYVIWMNNTTATTTWLLCTLLLFTSLSGYLIVSYLVKSKSKWLRLLSIYLRIILYSFIHSFARNQMWQLWVRCDLTRSKLTHSLARWSYIIGLIIASNHIISIIYISYAGRTYWLTVPTLISSSLLFMITTKVKVVLTMY